MISAERIRTLLEEAQRKVRERSPELGLVSVERMGEILKTIIATSATSKPDVCDTGCNASNVVAIYCGQVVSGPSLADFSTVTEENFGKQWARQAIRCTSESALEYHSASIAKRAGILPILEAERILKIVTKRAETEKDGRFWKQAKSEISEYIGKWTAGQEQAAKRRWSRYVR